MRKLNILLVDDHQQILEAVQSVLNSHPRTGSVDAVADGLLAYNRVRNPSDYDIYIIDLHLPGMDGFQLIRHIREIDSKAKIIINTMCEEIWDVKRIMEMGVMGVVVKTSSLSHLLDAIDSVSEGKRYFCPKFRHIEKQVELDGTLNFSKRELAVLDGIAEGIKTEELAAEFGISVNTVESIRKRLLVKLEVRNMGELTAKAVRTGILANYRTDAPPE